MKTRKYFSFVCILIIFTVVFAFTGCKSDAGGNDEPPGIQGPEFKRIGYAPFTKKIGDNKQIDTIIFFMGTFDELTWRGIDRRLHSALEKLCWARDGEGEIISQDILFDIFGVTMTYDPKTEWYEQETPYNGPIVVYNGQNIDYEWYKVTGEKTLYELSGDEEYNYDAFWLRYGNVLYINYNKINELLVPIDDGNGGQKPALAVAILALHKAVTTDVLSQR